MKATKVEAGEVQRLRDLIIAATSSTGLAVELPLLQSIKSIVRASEENVHTAMEALLDCLRKKHSQVRYLAVLIIDELFTRSKLFRTLVAANFEIFLQLSLGYKSQFPLPAPSDRAALLREKALEVVEKWSELFGVQYKQVRLGYEYLKNTLHFKFPNIRETNARAAQERREREERTQDLLRKKFEQMQEAFPEMKKEIQSTIAEMDQCFTILNDVHTTAEAALKEESDQFLVLDNWEGNFEEFGVKSLRFARNHVEHPEAENFRQETQDTITIYDTLRDLFKVLKNKHIPGIQDLLYILMRVDASDQNARGSLLKEVIDMRNCLQEFGMKCEKLGIVLPERKPTSESENEDIIWEDGEAIEDAIKVSCKTSFNEVQVGDTSNDACILNEGIKLTKSSKQLNSLLANETKQALLIEAPILPWGSFLDGWCSEAAVPGNAKGLVLENHWGRVDPDAIIPPENVAVSKLRTSYYEPQRREIRPCLAPLKKGGLCQRRDLTKCPLHGPIVPRDEFGKQIAQDLEVEDRNTSVRASNEIGNVNIILKEQEGHDQMVETIAKQAVRNVRNRDEFIKEQKTFLRRKDREYNESVLRTAALGQSSQGMEEIIGDNSEVNAAHEGPQKRRKSGLASLLHKNPTAKDRLGQKLLIGRVASAAETHISRTEEFKYRDKFPNQW